MTVDHKISHKGQFDEIRIYTSSESWINKPSMDLWFVRIAQYLAEIELFENQKLSFDIFTLGHLQNILMEQVFFT